MTVLGDLQDGVSSLETYVAERLESGVSHRTINADLASIRAFCRWLLARQRIERDPTASMSLLNVDSDRRHERRPLTDDESRRLIQATQQSTRNFRGLTGRDRAMIYLLAQRTGLRRRELRSLTPRSFQLDSDPPLVLIRAENAKNRQTDRLPLPPDVAAALREYLKDRSPESILWYGSWWRRSSEMFQSDLAAIGIESFDADGRVLDFHGQRMTFITGLARAGVSPATAQRLARHSDVNITLGAYTHLAVEELAGAVGRLPSLNPTTNLTNELGDSASTEHCEAEIDDRLKKIQDAWKHLPEHIRQSIETLVSAGHVP